MRSEQIVDRVRGRLARALLVAAGGMLLAFASPAAAAADITVDAPAESTVGQTVTVSATVTDGGKPVADGQVAVTRKAVIGGTSGFVELARGVTDKDGKVTFEFLQLADNTKVAEMRIEYQGASGVESTEFKMDVLPGPQQYVSKAGVKIGFLNVTWLLAVIGLVWIILMVAVYQLIVISRARDGGKKTDRSVPYLVLGFVAFTAAGMFTVIITQPTMHANLNPSEPFSRAPGAVIGQQYEYVGHSSHSATRPDNLTGEQLFLENGCAGCHGLGAKGAVVGGELTKEMLSDLQDQTDEIRKGPKGMPAYSEHTLSDAEIKRIVDYLLTQK